MFSLVLVGALVSIVPVIILFLFFNASGREAWPGRSQIGGRFPDSAKQCASK